MTEYQGPNIYRVITQSSVAEIRFTYEELVTIRAALGVMTLYRDDELRMVLDCMDRIQRVITAMRTECLDRPTESKAYHPGGTSHIMVEL